MKFTIVMDLGYSITSSDDVSVNTNQEYRMSSSIKNVIEGATSASLTSEKWDDYFTICDYINHSPDQAKEVAKLLKRRLNSSMDQSSVSTWYCLLLIETCVKNTSYSFHIHVSNKEFLNDLTRVISSKHKPSHEIYIKVISMIQDWHEMFQDNSQLSDVTRVRAELMAKGHAFHTGTVQENIYDDFESTVNDNYSFEDPVAPPNPHRYRAQSAATHFHPPPRPSVRSNSVSTTPSTGSLYGQEEMRRCSGSILPYNTPGAVVPYQMGPHVAQSQFKAAYYNGVAVGDVAGSAVPVVPTEVQVVKLNCELELVSGNIRVMCDMISDLDNKTSSEEDMKFLEDLNRTCKEMQKRIVDLLTKVEHESLIQHLLLINDDLNNAFLRYDRLIRHQGIAIGRIPSAKGRNSQSLAPIHSQPNEDDHIYSECGPKNDQSGSSIPSFPIISSSSNRPPLPPIPIEAAPVTTPKSPNETLLINFDDTVNGDVPPSYDTAVRGGMAGGSSTAQASAGDHEEEYEDFDNLARSRLQSADNQNDTIDQWLTKQEDEYVLPSQVPSEVAKTDQLKKMKADGTVGESQS